MEALSSSEMSVLTRVTWRNIPKGAILQVSTFLCVPQVHTSHAYIYQLHYISSFNCD
jgi:hypothetical protein